MQTKAVVIAVIKKGDAILMRKKPDGSPPYKETWYLFGAEITAESTPEDALKQIVKQQTNIEIDVREKFSWDTEIKKDHDGIEKLFIYLDVICEYASGDLIAAEGIEKLEWVPVDKLADYDIVPPSMVVFEKLGYPL